MLRLILTTLSVDLVLIGVILLILTTRSFFK